MIYLPFHQPVLSMERHKWVNINPPGHSRVVCFTFEQLTFTTGGHSKPGFESRFPWLVISAFSPSLCFVVVPLIPTQWTANWENLGEPGFSNFSEVKLNGKNKTIAGYRQSYMYFRTEVSVSYMYRSMLV